MDLEELQAAVPGAGTGLAPLEGFQDSSWSALSPPVSLPVSPSISLPICLSLPLTLYFSVPHERLIDMTCVLFRISRCAPLLGGGGGVRGQIYRYQ